MKYIYSILALTATLCSGTVMGQDNDVHGRFTLQGGWGTGTPWLGDVHLTIPTAKAVISPYITIEGITPYSSKMTDERSILYMGNKNNYESSQELKSKGTDLRYGFTLRTAMGKGSLDAMAEGHRRRVETYGFWRERLTSPDGDLLSAYLWDVDIPHQDQDQVRAKVGYTLKGLRVEYALDYNQTFLDYERRAVSEGFGGSPLRMDSHTTDSRVLNNQARVSNTFNLGKGHQLTAGLGYLRNDIEREHELYRSRRTEACLGKPTFSHTYQTESAFAEYRFGSKALKASARLEYDLTHMWYGVNENENENFRRKPLHDIIPQAHVQWGVSRHDTLTADYRMIIKRPDADFLDPTHIYSAHSLDYGTADLIGIHINNFTLAYHTHHKVADYTATLGGIVVDDGFNAIWMVNKDGIRESYWGNEGKRRAYSLSQKLGIQAASNTRFSALATLLWDKRIAKNNVIDMSNEHWGITAKASLEQRFSPKTSVDVHGQYSEGNTLDLYSYEGRSYQVGLSLRQNLCRGLQMTMGYDYTDYPSIVITQGAVVKGKPVGYTGYIYNQPTNHHYAKFSLVYTM